MDHFAHSWPRPETYRDQAPRLWDTGLARWGRQINALEPYVRRIMRWGIIFALGWAAAASYYRVEHLWVQRASLTTEAVCEHKRAEGAIASAELDHPLPLNVTTDCLHQPAK